jgi:manganese transport protein
MLRHLVRASNIDVALTMGLFGGMSAAIFIVSLLASGLSSSVVGTIAGQIIMQDFVDWRIPLWLRRLITMVPTVIVAAWVSDATQALVREPGWC